MKQFSPEIEPGRSLLQPVFWASPRTGQVTRLTEYERLSSYIVDLNDAGVLNEKEQEAAGSKLEKLMNKYRRKS